MQSKKTFSTKFKILWKFRKLKIKARGKILMLTYQHDLCYGSRLKVIILLTGSSWWCLSICSYHNNSWNLFGIDVEMRAYLMRTFEFTNNMFACVFRHLRGKCRRVHGCTNFLLFKIKLNMQWIWYMTLIWNYHDTWFHDDLRVLEINQRT